MKDVSKGTSQVYHKTVMCERQAHRANSKCCIINGTRVQCSCVGTGGGGPPIFRMGGGGICFAPPQKILPKYS